MSAITAVILTAMFSTPIVHVQPNGIFESPRAPVELVAKTSDAKTETGIDEVALNDFVEQAAKRYQGIQLP